MSLLRTCQVTYVLFRDNLNGDSMIGNVLKYVRKKRNFKQQQISEIVGVARNTISQYETETIQPTFDIIEKIANECGYKIYFGVKQILSFT